MSALARLVPPAFEPGSVWLVGAGPGDPGLLTLHAAHALATADVVLHDALVPAEILELAATPRLEPVGKRAGGKRTPQLRINQRMIALAGQGLRVLRLKGGDPCLFGRGGEEALALAAAGVPFRIVPGVTSGLAGPALAGMPPTHRGIARSVAFITARETRGGLPHELDLAALARGAETLVFFMGLRQAAPLAEALIAAGRGADEAMAFISDASLLSQRVTQATLGTAAMIAADLPAGSPTLIVVGPSLALRDALAPLQQTAPMRLPELPVRATIS
jgi:uroporphyrin-III C-methyltransferase